MKAFLAAAVLAGFAASASAGEQVWRYVDARTGEVSYSNVQIKGKKGERVEIMAYPPAPAAPALPTAGPGAVGAPLPADVLRQIKADPGVRPPTGLPPLPGLPGAMPATAPAAPPAPKPQQAQPQAQPQAQRQAPEPSWAKEVPAQAGQSPAWAQDPFAGK